METLEAIKTILEIIVIFLTFPQYAPLLAAIVALGAVYSLLKDEDENEEEDQLTTTISDASEGTEQCPQTKEHPSTETPPQTKL